MTLYENFSEGLAKLEGTNQAETTNPNYYTVAFGPKINEEK